MVYPQLQGPSKEGVFTIHLGVSENRLDFEYIGKMHEILNKIETREGPTACVIGGEGKFFCNGLNTDILMEKPKELLNSFHRRKHDEVLSRLLTFPVPLVAAINGHAFAGGAMMALACDFRVMSESRGYLCINEVDIGLPLTPGMCALIKSKLDRSLWTPTMLGARRWGGAECYRNRIVDAVCEQGEVLKRAQALAASCSYRGASKLLYRGMKEEIYEKEAELLGAGIGRAMQSAVQLEAASKM